jgi:hypothetical protein
MTDIYAELEQALAALAAIAARAAAKRSYEA